MVSSRILSVLLASSMAVCAPCALTSCGSGETADTASSAVEASVSETTDTSSTDAMSSEAQSPSTTSSASSEVTKEDIQRRTGDGPGEGDPVFWQVTAKTENLWPYIPYMDQEPRSSHTVEFSDFGSGVVKQDGIWYLLLDVRVANYEHDSCVLSDIADFGLYSKDAAYEKTNVKLKGIDDDYGDWKTEEIAGQRDGRPGRAEVCIQFKLGRKLPQGKLRALARVVNQTRYFDTEVLSVKNGKYRYDLQATEKLTGDEY